MEFHRPWPVNFRKLKSQWLQNGKLLRALWFAQQAIVCFKRQWAALPLLARNHLADLHPLRVIVPVDRQGNHHYQHNGEEWPMFSGQLILTLVDEQFYSIRVTRLILMRFSHTISLQPEQDADSSGCLYAHTLFMKLPLEKQSWEFTIYSTFLWEMGSISTWMTEQNYSVSLTRLYADDPYRLWMILIGWSSKADEYLRGGSVPWLIAEKNVD